VRVKNTPPTFILGYSPRQIQQRWEFTAANYLTGLTFDLKLARDSLLNILNLFNSKIWDFKFSLPESIVTAPM
jgi:hypothetical protein